MILDSEAYKSEMSRLLSDRDTYVPLAGNPTAKFKKERVSLVEEGYQEKIFSKKEKSFLVPAAPWVPVIYYLPSVQKDPVHPPGRPIISGINLVTSRVGKYIDHFLQPLVTKTPSFLKNSMQVINSLKMVEWKDSHILATADVSSLYTIISHQHGWEALRHYLESDDLVSSQREFILLLLDFPMGHNYFWFGRSFYL